MFPKCHPGLFKHQNYYDIQSFKTQRKYIHRIPTTSTPNHRAQRIGATSVSLLNLNTTEKLFPVGKEYMCFRIDGKYSQADKCVKSRTMTQVIDCVILTDIFEQKFVMLKGMLQSTGPEDQVKTIGIDQSLSNSAIFNKYVFKTSINYTNMMGSVTTNNNSKIFLSAIWFLLLDYSPIIVPYIP